MKRRFSLVSTVVSIICVVNTLVLLGFVILRETPMFWRNAGGYPIWLRDLVQGGFYPLLGLTAAMVFGMSVRLFRRTSYSALFWGTQCLCLMMSWVFLLMAMTMAISNNVINLMEGRSLHSHHARLH